MERFRRRGAMMGRGIRSEPHGRAIGKGGAGCGAEDAGEPDACRREQVGERLVGDAGPRVARCGLGSCGLPPRLARCRVRGPAEGREARG